MKLFKATFDGSNVPEFFVAESLIEAAEYIVNVYEKNGNRVTGSLIECRETYDSPVHVVPTRKSEFDKAKVELLVRGAIVRIGVESYVNALDCLDCAIKVLTGESDVDLRESGKLPIETEARSDLLAGLGLKFNGKGYALNDINVHWTEITCDTDEMFLDKVKKIENEIKRRKEKDCADH